MKGLVWWSNG